jgi:hypothetical protein
MTLISVCYPSIGTVLWASAYVFNQFSVFLDLPNIII